MITCENCEIRKQYAKCFDVHFDWRDCPYDGESNFCALHRPADPVKHGKWIPVNERAAKCSLCGEWEYTNGKDKTGTAIIHRAIKHYCPNCGARMDGE